MVTGHGLRKEVNVAVLEDAGEAHWIDCVVTSEEDIWCICDTTSELKGVNWA